MKNLWTINNLVENTHGVLLSEEASAGGLTFCTVNTDSRKIQSGDCYIAIKGEKFDGHLFVDEAFKKGAVAALVSQIDTTKPLTHPLILVEDTRIALGQFAAWHRQQMPLKSLIGVTGSNGKTTTKTILKTLLQRQGQTLVTQGNLNNDFGVPRTLLSLTQADEYAVVEMGANHEKEIDYLTQLARPNIALITNASGAHLEGFGDLETVIRTKGEILNGLTPDGIAVLNQDSPGFAVWEASCQQKNIRYLSFGESATADVSVKNGHFSQGTLSFDLSLKLNQTTYSVKMPILGWHNALNAAAAVACCLAAGLKINQILPGLADFEGVKGRLKTYSLPSGLLIDDAYNANPASVKAGIDALVSLTSSDELPILVLGGMAELGKTSVTAHQEMAHYIKQKGIENLFVYGDLAKPMADAFGEGAHWFATHESLNTALVDYMTNLNDQPYHILIKGSRSAGMEAVVTHLLGAF